MFTEMLDLKSGVNQYITEMTSTLKVRLTRQYKFVSICCPIAISMLVRFAKYVEQPH